MSHKKTPENSEGTLRQRAVIYLSMLAMALFGGIAFAQQAGPADPGGGKPATQVAAPAPAGPPPSSPPSLTKADLDIWLDGFMPYALRTGDVAGAVVVVVKDGQVLTQRGFGYADVATRKPVDPETTLFRPGSVSKLFTWTAVMQQVEAGRIDLDADINRYLDFRIPPRDGKPVTMRQLMTHTAGFEDRFKGLIITDPGQMRSLRDYLKSWVPRRIYAPGATPSYSNYATALAGYVVERVSGTPFVDYVAQHIFAPLGMEDSSFAQPLPKRLLANLSNGYPRASAKAGKFEYTSAGPAGSLSLTAPDMARFMIAHLNQGAGLMRPETARMMHDTPTTILPHLNRMELGFFESNINGRQVIGHLGDTALFHAAMHLFMNEKVGLYIAVNSSGRGGAANTIRVGLFQDFADRYFPAPARAAKAVDAATAAEHARMMAGLWQGSRRSENGFMRMLNLMQQSAISTNDKGELVVDALNGGGVRKWVEVEPFLWHEVGGHERLAAKVENGKVVRWSTDFFSPFLVFDRVPASRSATWIMPLLYAALAILLIAFLHWPTSALVRRHYKTALPLAGRPRLAYRGVRLSAGLILAVLGGWMVAAGNLMTLADATLSMLQIAGLIVFPLAIALAAWNAVLAFQGGRTWPGKAGAVLILLATLFIAWTAFSFGLLTLSVQY